MTPEQFEASALGAFLAFVVFALAAAGWIKLEWEWSRDMREARRHFRETHPGPCPICGGYHGGTWRDAHLPRQDRPTGEKRKRVEW